MLDRLDKAIAEREAQNEAGQDEAAANLPGELADKEVLREQIRQAMREFESLARQRGINLTDRDARLMKSSQGIVPGYSTQIMVSSLEPSADRSGMLVTTVDVVDEPNDFARLIPILEQTEEATGAKAQVTLADSVYRSGPQLITTLPRRLAPQPHCDRRLTCPSKEETYPGAVDQQAHGG